MNPRYCILDYRIRHQDEVMVSALSPALLYGDSLFETLPVVETVPVFLEEHLARLNFSAAALGYATRLKEGRVRVAVDHLLTGNLLEQGRLRITLFRGRPLAPASGDPAVDPELAPLLRGAEVTEHVLMQVAGLDDRAPCAAGLARVNNRHLDPLARHKTGNRLFYRLFRHWDATGPGEGRSWLFPCQSDEREVLVVDELDRLLEGTVSNIFLVVDGCALTPPREVGILPGIVRGRVLDDERLPAEVRILKLGDLERASEAFLTNSVVGIRPLTRVGGRSFDEAPGPLTRRAMASLENQILRSIAPLLP
ncbi:MAG: aminotransferase class IV [bacterium]|jgi:branched-chain amino acid aminotransferase|nr:aminotransferase class IV [bacterium]